MNEVSLEEARRIAVHAQLLDGSATSVLGTVRTLGYLQIDPISTVAPPQHLVLWSRLAAFDLAEFDRLLWQDRKLVEWHAVGAEGRLFACGPADGSARAFFSRDVRPTGEQAGKTRRDEY